MNANTLNQYDAQFNTTAPFCNLEVVDLIADGLQVALLGQTRQQRLHAVVELLFAIKLDGKENKCFIQANKTINRWDLTSEALNKDQPNGSQASCLLTDLRVKKQTAYQRNQRLYFSSLPIFNVEEHTCLSSVWFLVCLEAISPV